MRKITFRQALNEAFMEEMTRDETVIALGECVSNELFLTMQGLYEKFGPKRIRDTSISEAAIAGAAVGAALSGSRPIACMQFGDFFFIAGDEILNKAAKWRFEHGGTQSIPMVISAAVGAYIHADAEHTQCPESVIMHTPGLKLVVPSTPYDAKGLMKTAIRDNNPVVFLEHKLLLAVEGEVPEEEYLLPFGQAEIRREGTDVTVVATMYMVGMALEVARQLEGQGVSVEVIDPRTLEPLDMDTILASVRKTGRAVIVDEDTLRCGVTAEIATQIMEQAFDHLDAPIQRVAAANMPIPGGMVLDKYALPQPHDIVEAISRVTGKELRVARDVETGGDPTAVFSAGKKPDN